MQRALKVKSREISNGLGISVRGRTYKIGYPEKVWRKTSATLRSLLRENLAVATTHFLPLMLGYESLEYDSALPLFESQLFRNQLNDLLSCERADGKPHLEYTRHFYNQELNFSGEAATLPDRSCAYRADPKVVVLPFTFGKESLLTFALCLELGLKPVLVYCQEPVQPHEQQYKIKKLTEIGRIYKCPTYFIKNDTGLFRYGRAFRLKRPTELGWGTQTTILTLMMLPFCYAHRARYILYGSEFANNEYRFVDGWKAFLSCDQTPFWTEQQSNMIRVCTGGACEVRTSLEPLEEISIFGMLHRRYPKLGKYQFSCSAERPLVRGTQWCHRCYKCERMFLFARVLDIAPESIGFKRDLLREPGHFKHYFGSDVKTGSEQELDFAFYALYRKGHDSPYLRQFKQRKLARLRSWQWYVRHYGAMKSGSMLPPSLKGRLLRIFSGEMRQFLT